MRTIAWVIVGILAVALCFGVVALSFATETALGLDKSPGLGSYDAPFWPDGTYRTDVTTPSEYLGRTLGAWPASYEEILGYLEYLADNFSNVSLHTYANTYESRSLVYLAVTSEENAPRLDAIRAATAKLADPRTMGKAKPEQLIESTPATAFMFYGIHGDELSSCDAALQLAYQLVAGTDAATKTIRDNVVVLIDPSENPDGRARWLKQLEQWNGVVPNGDTQSMQHQGIWPWGRGNHYLFDMNRDWFAQVHPVSQRRTHAALEWHPQFVLDCHEMGSDETYLFSPPREPFNPYMVSYIYKWWDALAAGHAAAFDRYGWPYYTREWNEEFYPGYGSSWGIYTGAVGMLYEQASADGSIVHRPDGTVMTYRETVHHQFTASMANLGTVATHRVDLLQDFYNEKRAAAGLGGRVRMPKGGAFLFPPSANVDRLDEFVRRLVWQDIDVSVATKAFKVSGPVSSIEGKLKSVELPEGTLIVDVNQPMRALIETMLTFDIRMPTRFLETERREVLKKNNTRLYDATSWSFPLAYGVESYYVESPPRVTTTPYTIPDAETGQLVGSNSRFGYAIDITDDRAYLALARLFERDVRVWSAKSSFAVGGRVFPPGSLVIRRNANPNLEDADMRDLAVATGVDVYTVDTALGGRLADLGGNEFALLDVPRIGIVGGPGTSTYSFGLAWFLVDHAMAYRVATLDAASLPTFDLRPYNVIVLPQAGDYKRMIGDDGIEKLKTWVQEGGTLVAIGQAAAFCADTSIALSSVRQRRQVLEELDDYERALALAYTAETADVDSLNLWDAKTPKTAEKRSRGETASEGDPNEEEEPSLDAIKQTDEVARKLRPRGTIMAADVDSTQFLVFGVPSPAPVIVSTDYVFLAKPGVQVAARFAPAERLRLSGLLWPEARARWAETAYATREPAGNGQVILFAYEPAFRGFFHPGERMFLNAILLGPGFGTKPPSGR